MGCERIRETKNSSIGGVRASMERRWLINAKSTVMRQKKWQEVRLQKELDDQQKKAEILAKRKEQRARLASYIHATVQPSTKCNINSKLPHADSKRSKWNNSLLQDQELIVKLRENVKAIERTNLLNKDCSKAKPSLQKAIYHDDLKPKFSVMKSITQIVQPIQCAGLPSPYFKGDKLASCYGYGKEVPDSDPPLGRTKNSAHLLQNIHESRICPGKCEVAVNTSATWVSKSFGISKNMLSVDYQEQDNSGDNCKRQAGKAETIDELVNEFHFVDTTVAMRKVEPQVIECHPSLVPKDETKLETVVGLACPALNFIEHKDKQALNDGLDLKEEILKSRVTNALATARVIAEAAAIESCLEDCNVNFKCQNSVTCMPNSSTTELFSKDQTPFISQPVTVEQPSPFQDLSLINRDTFPDFIHINYEINTIAQKNDMQNSGCISLPVNASSLEGSISQPCHFSHACAKKEQNLEAGLHSEQSRGTLPTDCHQDADYNQEQDERSQKPSASYNIANTVHDSTAPKTDALSKEFPKWEINWDTEENVHCQRATRNLRDATGTFASDICSTSVSAADFEKKNSNNDFVSNVPFLVNTCKLDTNSDSSYFFEQSDRGSSPGRESKISSSIPHTSTLQSIEACKSFSSSSLKNGYVPQYQGRLADKIVYSKMKVPSAGLRQTQVSEKNYRHHCEKEDTACKTYSGDKENHDLGLLEEEQKIFASLERLDWKLAAINTKSMNVGRESMISQGNYSIRSAPAAIGPPPIRMRERSTMSRERLIPYSTLPPHAFTPPRPQSQKLARRRRQLVGLTNKIENAHC